jgi:hypothetical protein
MPDLTDTILQAAQEPQSAASDGQSATAHSLKDLVETDRYLRQQAGPAGLTRKSRGLRFNRIVPPGSAG